MWIQLKAAVYIFVSLLIGLPCQTGWKKLENSCFILSEFSNYTWDEAQQECVKYGGKLAELTSSAKDTFIETRITVGSWIGLKRNSSSGYRWVSDNGDPGYSSWAAGEPSGLEVNDSCVVLSAGGEWFEVGCDFTAGVVCEDGEYGNDKVQHQKVPNPYMLRRRCAYGSWHYVSKISLSVSSFIPKTAI